MLLDYMGGFTIVFGYLHGSRFICVSMEQVYIFGPYHPPGLGFVVILYFSPMKPVGHRSEFVYFLFF